jgi:hypothetical protein
MVVTAEIVSQNFFARQADDLSFSKVLLAE